MTCHPDTDFLFPPVRVNMSACIEQVVSLWIPRHRQQAKIAISLRFPPRRVHLRNRRSQHRHCALANQRPLFDMCRPINRVLKPVNRVSYLSHLMQNPLRESQAQKQKQVTPLLEAGGYTARTYTIQRLDTTMYPSGNMTRKRRATFAACIRSAHSHAA